MSTISMELIKKLRDRTQVGIMDCRKALEETNGDFEAAVEVLRKKGAAVAAKRADNVTNQGRVEHYLNNDNTIGTLIEMACETDFAANTEAMHKFACAVAESLSQKQASTLDEVLALPLQSNKAITVKQELEELVAKICENIKINQFIRFETNTNGLINAYIHPGSTVGVMVELAADKSVAANKEDLKVLARDICMQVAVMNPLCLRPEELDAEVLERERALAAEQLQGSTKPAPVIEKIIEGKISKFYQDACLLNQVFIKNDKLTVNAYVQEIGKKCGLVLTVKRFKRCAIGR